MLPAWSGRYELAAKVFGVDDVQWLQSVYNDERVRSFSKIRNALLNIRYFLML